MCMRLVRSSLFAMTAAAAAAAIPAASQAAATDPSAAASKEWTVTPSGPLTVHVAMPRDPGKSMIELNVVAIEPSGAKPKIRLFAGSGVPAKGANSDKYLGSFETSQGGTGTYRFVGDLSDALSEAQHGNMVDVTIVVLPAETSARRNDVSVTIGNLDIQDASKKPNDAAVNPD
jgi:hypothetical protein